MKEKLIKLLFVLSIACSLGLLSVPTQALAYYYGYGPVRCAWVGGHWYRGYWVPAHRNCWRGGYYRNYGGCVWVPGHWRYGAWVPAHRVCN